MNVNGMVEKSGGEKNINVQEISVFLEVRKQKLVKEPQPRRRGLCVDCSGDVTYSALCCSLGFQRGRKHCQP